MKRGSYRRLEAALQRAKLPMLRCAGPISMWIIDPIGVEIDRSGIGRNNAIVF
jgi:hypothetical protein